MKDKIVTGAVVIAVICAILLLVGIQYHGLKIATIEEKYEKAVLITPTDEWIELHGDDLASWQTFNIKVLVNNVQNAQGVKK